jgi:hypothetical protein
MGTTTPNMSIYIPADGETNYGTSFSNGMLNVDAHDHSGAPDNGVPLSASGLAAGSVTRDKLNANVFGIGVQPDVNNAIEVAGVLKPIFQLGSNGLIARTSGSTAAARTITGTANQITVADGDGVSGNPTLSFPTTFFEEGTWTPTLRGASTAGSNTYTTQYGIYQRVGNWVECYGYILTATVSGMTGALQIGGFPFTFNNNASNFVMGQVDVAISTSTVAPAGSSSPFIRGNANGTTATLLFYDPTTGADTTYDSATWVNVDDLAFKIRFRIQ